MHASPDNQTGNSSTLPELFELFIRDRLYLKNWSQKTVRSYRQAFTSFQAVDRVENTPQKALDLTRARLEAWVINMRSRGLTPGACNVYIRGFNSFLSWLEAEQHIRQRLRLGILKQEEKSLQTFSAREIHTILDFKPKRFTEWRLWTLMYLLFDTGCRIDEVLNLKTSDVDLDNLLLTIHGKWKKERKVPFGLEFRKTLWRFIQLKQKRHIGGAHVFCTFDGGRLMYRNLRRDIDLLLKEIGITSDTNPHKFRHTYATRFIANGGNPFQLKRLMGHNSIQTTLKYVHLQTEDLKQAHSEFGLTSKF